jgi:hypothetical protein
VHSCPPLCLFFGRSQECGEIRQTLLLRLLFVLAPIFSSAQSSNSCGINDLANAERRLCYSKALQYREQHCDAVAHSSQLGLGPRTA